VARIEEITLRHLFDEIVELPPSLREAKIGALDIGEAARANLRMMVAFDELIRIPPDQRDDELANLTLTDADRVRLKHMLATDARVPELLQTTAQTPARLGGDDELAQSLVGTNIGTFRLLALIGQGGSSVVFSAERAAGDGSQVVAVKLLRTGLYSADAQRRFRREQAILAQLTHPNIASLIEGGVSDAGIPYIAMELVDGVPITRAASARALSIEQRLILFCKLCRTIEAAHAALIVHRDLKPSNLLITRSGELKVLDFGIARLVDVDDTATRTQSVALTPEYAAPEQYRAGPLTTAVDIYALGVVLGELLTGKRLVANARASHSVAAKISDDKNQTPSGLPAPQELTRKLRGDLDSILMTALADDPAMRYRSADAFADDIERYLAGRPVRAHPPSRWYRTRKFVSRHRIGFAVTAVLIVGMCSAFGIAVWQGIQARRSAATARAEAARADSMRNFMFNAFAQAEPTTARKNPVTVIEVVNQAIDAASNDRAIDPRARAELLARLGEVLGTQGDLTRSGALLANAHEQAAKALGDDDPVVWDIARLQAVNQMMRGELAEAGTSIDALMTHLPAMPIALRSKVLLDSAAIARHVRNPDRALVDARNAVATARLTNDSDLLLSTLDELGAVLLTVPSYREAIDVYQDVLALDRARFGEQSSQVADAMSGLARAYRDLDDLDHSEEYARAALAIDKAIYPGDHWIVANHLNALGITLRKKRNFSGSLEAFREALRIAEATQGADHPDTTIALQSLAFVEMQLENYADAIPKMRRALTANSSKFGEHSYYANFIRSDLGFVIASQGDYRAGAAEIDRAIDEFQALPDPVWDDIARALEKRIRVALLHDDATHALRRIDQLADVASKTQDQGSYWNGRIDCLRGEILLSLQRASEAEILLASCGAKLDSEKKPEAVLYVAQPLLRSAALQATGDATKAHAFAAIGRQRLSNLASPPSRLVKLEATLAR
jgi:eukaryotic-like serine/threonine-protein kinase